MAKASLLLFRPVAGTVSSTAAMTSALDCGAAPRASCPGPAWKLLKTKRAAGKTSSAQYWAKIDSSLPIRSTGEFSSTKAPRFLFMTSSGSASLSL